MNAVSKNSLGSRTIEGDVLRDLGSISAIRMDASGQLPLNVDPGAARRPPLHHPGRMCGSIFSTKNNRRIGWESSLERDALRLLEWHPYISGYRAQPSPISYEWQGKVCSYTPDIFVPMGGGLVVEVKPAKRVETPEFQVWAHEISKVCAEQGRRFSVWTENELRVEPRTHNIAYLLNCRRHPKPVELTEVVIERVTQQPGLSFDDLLNALGGGTDARIALLRAMAWHELRYDIERDLNASPLFPGASR